MSEFALFIWVNDKPVQGSVLNMINIIEPRCDLKDYKVGQKVRVKFRGFGDHEAVIGMISGKFFLKIYFHSCNTNASEVALSLIAKGGTRGFNFLKCSVPVLLECYLHG